MHYTAQNLVFLEEHVPNNDVCIIPKHLWSKWTRNQLEELLLVKIVANKKEHTLHIHSYHENSKDIIYIPSWCFSDFPLEVEMKRVSSPPIATKITLQPLDTEVYHCDIAKAVSEHLSSWHILTEGTILTVPCEELGGFPVDIYVQKTEPETTVLLRGEVPMELAEPIEKVIEWEKPPPPPHLEESIPEDFDQMLATTAPPKAEGFVPFSGKGNKLC